MSEMLFRSSTLTGVDKKQRLIELIAVPWDQEADIIWRGELWHEVFRRGAFDGIELSAGRVPATREHNMNNLFGKVVSVDPYSDLGLVAQIKAAPTLLGTESLDLADEDMVSASIGFRVDNPSDVKINKRTMLREVVRAFLDHISLVAQPAYKGAQVLAVREDQSSVAVVETPLPETPVLDEFLNDDVFAWAKSRHQD